LTAETYSRAWKSRERFRGDENAALGWLLTIARRLVIDTRRKEEANPLGEDIDAFSISAQEPGLEQQALTREQRALLWKSLQALPFEQREMLVLRYILGWKVDTIAAHQRKSENAVYVAVHRALARMRANWPQIEKDKNHDAE
jgi:RNA polymerase sigma-70 factor (ECF subfamily)